MKSQFIRGILVIFGAFLFFSALADERFFLDDQQKSIVLGKHFLFLQDNTKITSIPLINCDFILEKDEGNLHS